MTGQILYLLGVLTGLAVGAALWYGRRALADRARDGEGRPTSRNGLVAKYFGDWIIVYEPSPYGHHWKAQRQDYPHGPLPLTSRSRRGLERQMRAMARAMAKAGRMNATIGSTRFSVTDGSPLTPDAGDAP